VSSRSLLPGRSAAVSAEFLDKYEHADVPGSSLPSGQSQKSSLTAEKGIWMAGCEMQANVLGSL
jgi:hypothetical protein